MKIKMDELEARKAELEAGLCSADNDLPVLLHPGLSGVYREKVAGLTRALNDPATKPEASDIIRRLLSQITLVPEGDTLVIELVGELAGLLSLAGNQNTRGVSAAGVLYHWLREQELAYTEQLQS